MASWWGSTNVENPNEDTVCSDPPTDQISCIRFSPSSDLFITADWNNEVRAYGYDNNFNVKYISNISHNKPVLTCDWDPTGQYIISAGCENNIKVWNIQNKNVNNIGTHNAPIRSIVYNSSKNVLISGSWDHHISYWDLRQNKQVGNVNCGHKIWKLVSNSDIIATVLSNNYVCSFDFRNINQPFRNKETPLKHQIRDIDLFSSNISNGGGYAVCGVEGRTAIEHWNDKIAKDKNFSFKCHKQPHDNSTKANEIENIFSVNVLKFHPLGTFATGGSDGQINIWDKDNRSRLKHFKRLSLPIVALDFNRTGAIMGYCTSYDWGQGLQGHNPNKNKPQIYLHSLKKSIDLKGNNNNRR